MIDGVRGLLNFLIRGEQRSLEAATQALLQAIRAPSSQADITSRWVAAHLFRIAGDLRATSIWSALPPSVGPEVRRAFSVASPRVLTLWPPQLELLGSGTPSSPLNADVRRAFISIPTSSGKTLLSQLLVLSHIASTNTGVCFVAPTRSLVREVRSSLRRRLRYLDAQVSTDILDAPDEGGPVARVEVMTPERLAYLIRTNHEDLLGRFGLFIVDEAHLLGDKTRGWTLEASLAFLHHKTEETAHRLILMSAAMGNQLEIANWLDPTGEGTPYTSRWRGPRRMYGIYQTEADRDARTRVNTGRQILSRYPLFGAIHLRPPVDGGDAKLVVTEPVGELFVRANHTREAGRSTKFYRMLPPSLMCYRAVVPF